MKTVLSIQDLSCVGRCSLTVALPVLSAMGLRCSALPTAVLSTHTGFPNPAVVSLTEHIGEIGQHLQSVGAAFDGVTVGYLSDPAQAQAVLPLLQQYKAAGSRIIADPAMGDHGKLYRNLGPEQVSAMAAICSAADVLLPNVTEACLLSGMPYQENPGQGYLKMMAELLLYRFPADTVIITGVSGSDGRIGFFGYNRSGEAFSHEERLVKRSFHGTGDLFTAVFTGAWLLGKSPYEAGVLAAKFVRQCIAATEEITPHGVCFETQLPSLFALIQEKSC